MMLPQERASLTAEIPKHPDQDNGLTGFSSYELTDLSSIVQSLPAVIYTYTVNSDTGECNFPFVSDYSEEMFGLPSSKIVENSEAFVNLVHPDDANEFAESVLHSMIHLTVWDHKMRMKDVNGEIVYVHAKSTPSLREIVNDDGSITKITIWNGVLFDVTNNSIEKEESDSKENNDNTEETISKKMTKTISKKMTMKRPIEDTWQSYLPCFEIDKDGTILSWNKVMTELTIGLLEQDVIGKNVRSIVPNTRQGKKEVERFLKANLNLLSVSDHSASSAEEEDLLESLDSSSSCEQIKQCEKHLEVYLHNLRVLTKTSTEIHLRVNSQKIGNNHTLICTCTDVTSLREAEKDRTDALRLLDAEKKLTEWLAHEVRNPLSIAMEAAQSLQEEFESDSFTPSQQTEQKEDQTYKSHNMEPDSFTPSQQTEQKEAQIYKSHNMDYHSYPDLIIQSISYVVEILSKMLDLNKVTEGKILLRPSVCSLRENIIRPIQEMMNLKGNKVPISISGEDMKIHIDTLRVKQVITNLISNALKFTNEGFINIHSYRTNKDVDGSDIPDSLVIAVSDSGVGVPSKNREQLFSRWEQLGTNVNGTGIGLCLSRFLVLAMKGQIYLNENYNSGIKDSPGAQFIVRFPMNVMVATEKDGQPIHNVPAYAALSAAVKASNTEQVVDLQQNTKQNEQFDVNDLNNNSCVLGKYKILLVDDDGIVRKLLKRRFSRIFPQAIITELDCGEKAIEYTSSEHHFDIIFMDQFMGDGLNGDETIRKLRENHVDSMIVGISGNSKEMCHIVAGAEVFFQKPLPSQKMVIERLLQKLPPPAGWNVLIVDDSPLNCHFMKKKLYKVFTAHYTTLERAEKRLSISVSTSVEDAVSKLNAESFDLVVTGKEFTHDNDMKYLKGMDIVSFVRNHGLNKNAIIVLNSAIAQNHQHPQQFDMYWPKPLPSDDRMRQTLCEELLQLKVDTTK